MIVAGCNANEAPPGNAWPLACEYASFESFPEKLTRCAQRNADGELTIRPDLLADIVPGSEVQSLVVDGNWFFALPGKAVPALAYDNGADYFQEGLARTVQDGKIGFVNESLDLVVAPVWDFAWPFVDGFALVCNGCQKVTDGEHTSLTGGGWGYIDSNGKVIVEPVHARESLPQLPE